MNLILDPSRRQERLLIVDDASQARTHGWDDVAEMGIHQIHDRLKLAIDKWRIDPTILRP